MRCPMNEDKAREICERIVRYKFCYITWSQRELRTGEPCRKCPFLFGGLRDGLSCWLLLAGPPMAEVAQMFLDGEIVLVDGKLYEV